MGFGQNHGSGQKFVAWERLIIKPSPAPLPPGTLVVCYDPTCSRIIAMIFFFFAHQFFQGQEVLFTQPASPNAEPNAWREGSAPSSMNKGRTTHRLVLTELALPVPHEAGGAGD